MILTCSRIFLKVPLKVLESSRIFYIILVISLSFQQIPGSSTYLQMLKKIENVSNKGFSLPCQWFLDNKLSIHFGEDKTKSILFSKARGSRDINISFAGHSIPSSNMKQYSNLVANSMPN